jgi:O-antigen ligase
MGVYVLLLIFLGLAIGIKGEMNAYFRILKQTFPLLLFFSIPRLFRNRDDYMRVFALIFPVALFASAAQLYEIITQEPISAVLGAKEFVEEDLADDEASRSFYNTCVTLLSMFASLFYASYRGNKFNSIYLSFLTMAALSMAFLSATRGWIIAFGVTLILSVIFVTGFKLGRLLVFFGVGLLALILVMSVPVLKSQMTKATERFLTVESITEGDVTAGDTQIRTTIRGPRVMKKWSESPVLGYGFSDERRAYDDVHVGNQNILLHSGIIGLTLILAFFAYFMFEMFQTSMQKSDKSLLVFIFFFIGFFFIHSTSGQMFGYSLIPRYAFTPAVFCSFGAFIIAEIKGLNYSNTGE